MLRLLAIATALVCGPVSAAHAQAEVPVVATASDEHNAARGLYQSILFDSGAIHALFGAFSEQVIPDVERSIEGSPIYRYASPDRQQAVIAFIRQMPAILEAEFTGEFGQVMGDRVAPRFAAIMTAEEMTQIAEFMRSPPMQEGWARMMNEVVFNDKADSEAFPEWRSHADFANSPGGRALDRHEDTIDAILSEEFAEAIVLFEPRMRVLLAGGLCDALGDECPSELRDSLGRT